MCFSTVVGWSHFTHESRTNPPSPALNLGLKENARCSAVEMGSTQTSSE